MEKIPSFKIDHTKLEPGIYESRVDIVGNEYVTTYDLRMKRPNKEPFVHPNAMHTIEHLVATYLRNNETWKDKVIYFGPMGCLTGCYLILKGRFSPVEICPLIIDAFKFCANYDGNIPGATESDCGNYLFNDLNIAKYEANLYYKLLKTTPCFTYP